MPCAASRSAGRAPPAGGGTESAGGRWSRQGAHQVHRSAESLEHAAVTRAASADRLRCVWVDDDGTDVDGPLEPGEHVTARMPLDEFALRRDDGTEPIPPGAILEVLELRRYESGRAVIRELAPERERAIRGALDALARPATGPLRRALYAPGSDSRPAEAESAPGSGYSMVKGPRKYVTGSSHGYKYA